MLLQELESRVTPLNAEYWGCLLTLAEHELEAQRCVDTASDTASDTADTADNQLTGVRCSRDSCHLAAVDPLDHCQNNAHGLTSTSSSLSFGYGQLGSNPGQHTCARVVYWASL